MTEQTVPHDHGDHTHDHGDHTHDAACDAAHGTVVPETDARRLVAVFDAPVAHELVALAGRLGWSVALVDPDPARGQALAAAGLDERTDVVVCDHDRPELGDVLAEVLGHPTRWVGVMGSRRHTAPHVEALRERGLDEATIARVHRPIGLDIGSRTPAEIAVATIAGLLADRNGRTGGQFGA